MSEETPDLGFPPLPISDTGYVDSIEVGTIKAGVIGSGKINGKEITLAGANGIIRSEDFVAGSTGWAIKGNGDAEFNNLTVRGDVISANWDGTSPPDTLGHSADATTGFYINADGDAAQFQKLYASALEIRGNSELLGNIVVDTAGFMQSSNYSASVSGWRIEGDGDAEFNDVTVRGTIVATSGSISNLTISGTLTMGVGGLIRTASSGERVQFSNNGLSDIEWFNSSGSSQGIIGVNGVSGILISAGNGITLVANSVIQVTVATLNLNANLTMETNKYIRAYQGNASVPGFAFTNSTNSGMYHTGTALAWSVGGTGRITVGSGFFGPISDNSLACGSGGNRWTVVYAVNGTINTSDGEIKQNIQDLPRTDALAQIMSVRPVSYRWRHNPARIHRGLVAQDLLGGPFHDAVYQEGGEFGLAYHEFIGPMLAAIQELVGRVEELESV